MALEPWHYALLAPFARTRAVSLSQASARTPSGSPADWTHEGVHVRCFERIAVCNNFRRAFFPLPNTYWLAGQHILRYYSPQLPNLRRLPALAPLAVGRKYPGWAVSERRRAALMARLRKEKLGDGTDAVGAGANVAEATPVVTHPLRVVVASRANARTRSLLNLEDVLEWCRGWAPPVHPVRRSRARLVCVAHDFGAVHSEEGTLLDFQVGVEP